MGAWITRMGVRYANEVAVEQMIAAAVTVETSKAHDEIEHLRKVLSAIQEAAEDGSAAECYVFAKAALARTPT